MKKAAITRAQMDELLRFLPIFDKAGPDIEPKWHGLNEDATTGVITMPYPTYSQEVHEFFRLAGQDWWCDRDYEPAEAAEMVRSDSVIASASLSQIKTMLTFCVRGERFSDGHWDQLIRQGRITALLRRLEHLRGTLE